MQKQAFALLIGCGLLAGCQTANVQYQRIGYGPDLEVAKAQCEIQAMGVGNGMVAWGTPSYVAGAQLGNAIGNAILQEQFKKNCMIIAGWKAIPVTTSQVAANRSRPALAPTTSQAPYSKSGQFKSPGLPKAPKPIS